MNPIEILAAIDEETARAPLAHESLPNWAWSDKLREKLAAHAELRSQHTEAWSTLTDAEADLREAIEADEKNRRNAAKVGVKDPGIKNTLKAAQAAEFALFAVQELRTATDAAWPSTQLRSEIQKRQAEFTSNLIERVEKETERFNSSLSDAQAIMATAQRRLDNLAQEIRWIGGKLDNVHFGTIAAGYEPTNWPRQAGIYTEGWIAKLEYARDLAQGFKDTALTPDNSFDGTYPDGTRV